MREADAEAAVREQVNLLHGERVARLAGPRFREEEPRLPPVELSTPSANNSEIIDVRAPGIALATVALFRAEGDGAGDARIAVPLDNAERVGTNRLRIRVPAKARSGPVSFRTPLGEMTTSKDLQIVDGDGCHDAPDA